MGIRRTRCRGHCHERVWLRRHGEGLRPPAENDPVYSEKAERIAALTEDLAAILPACTDKLRPLIASNDRRRVVFHPPCTLQHGQQIRVVVEGLLRSLDIDVRVPSDAHLRCGSAGTYSISQPALASQLRDNKGVALEATEPDLIVSANIGCISHLASASKAPVRHWIELLDDMLSQAHMIERWTGGGSWLRLALALAAVAVGVSSGKAASADWVRVASSPEVQVSVDTKSVTKDAHGWLGVWTKTVYASSQAAAGVQYSADMTRFVLDCSSLRYGITGGKLLDAHENVLLAFDSPADELQPVPPASKIDAVARTICATNYP